MFKFRSNSGQKCSPEPEPEQKCCSDTGTGIPVDLWFKDKTLAMMAKMNVIQEVTKTLMSLKGGSLEGKADVKDVEPIAEDKGTVLSIL